MISYIISYIIAFGVGFGISFWVSMIVEHWNDCPRLRTWYWLIWWRIIGPFYPINWWWKRIRGIDPETNKKYEENTQ
jgi:hypothetical protein